MADRQRSQRSWQELTKSDCFELLAGQDLGRVAVVDGRGPVVLPVNFVVDRHTVVFRTGEGTKLDAASERMPVAFEVDGTDAATRTGWSVVVRGEAAEITDPAELACLRNLPLRPWPPAAKSRYVRILPAMVTGRRITRTEHPLAWPGARSKARPGARSPAGRG